MMIILNILMGFIVLALPFLVGSVFRQKSVSFTYLIGQVFLWAVFQVIAVSAINLRTSFTLLFWIYTGVVSGLTIWGLRNRVKVKLDKPQVSVFHVLAFFIFVLLFYVYVADLPLVEDDAGWLKEANDALTGDHLLSQTPGAGQYIGKHVGETVLDAFSPWIFYIAWTSRMTSIQVEIVLQVFLPVILLVSCFLACWEISKHLFESKTDQGIFLLLVPAASLFIIRSVRSYVYSGSVVIWLGKESLVAVLIPLMMLIILKQQKDDSIGNWIGMILVGTACCLFFKIGIIAGFSMIAIFGLFMIINNLSLERKARTKRISLWILSLIPELVFGFGYLALNI